MFSIIRRFWFLSVDNQFIQLVIAEFSKWSARFAILPAIYIIPATEDYVPDTLSIKPTDNTNSFLSESSAQAYNWIFFKSWLDGIFQIANLSFFLT